MNAFPEDSNLSEPHERFDNRAPARENEDSSRNQEPPRPGPTEIALPPAADADRILAAAVPPDPVWNALDVVRLAILTLVALFVGIFAVLLIARFLVYPHSSIGLVARIPLVVVAGQGLAYLLVLSYMYILVTRERHRPDFLAAIHWNWPSSPAVYIAGGVVLSIVLQILASRLPIPKNLPIDTFFRTPAEAWVLGIFSVTLAPLMEELFFRGFLYPVLARGMGMTPAIFITAFAFALTHGQQLTYSWGPVLVIFLVGVVLTMVRAYKNSVAAGVVVHMAYNGTITVLMFVATDGFRHLDKLNQ